LMRCRELATICDVRVRDWLLENGFELITFGDLQR
ncbi:PTS cellbiose transporter subunit IIC, partial [Vibrio parahaemolyticus]|nr:PTS cellbiose transporter subunit IIC [Vibrio parahaemolyticus]